MPRAKRRKVEDDTDTTKFILDLDKLDHPISESSSSNHAEADSLFGRIITSHAAPYGGRVFTERYTAAASSTMTTMTAEPSLATLPDTTRDAPEQADSGATLDQDWDDFLRSMGGDDPFYDAQNGDEAGGDEEYLGEEAREGFSATFGLDDVEQRQEPEPGDLYSAMQDAEVVKVRRRPSLNHILIGFKGVCA